MSESTHDRRPRGQPLRQLITAAVGVALVLVTVDRVSVGQEASGDFTA